MKMLKKGRCKEVCGKCGKGLICFEGIDGSKCAKVWRYSKMWKEVFQGLSVSAKVRERRRDQTLRL